MIQLQKKHIKEIHSIGKCGDKALSLLKTYGGLCVIAMMKNGKPEILSFASHSAIAKFQAEKNTKEKIEWTDG